MLPNIMKTKNSKHFQKLEVIPCIDSKSYTALLYCRDENKNDWCLKARGESPHFALAFAWLIFLDHLSEWKKYGNMI